MTKHGLGCVGVLVLMAGCGNPVSSFLAEQEALADDVCPRCPQIVSGADSELSCRAALEVTVTDTEEACIRSVFNDNSDELGPIFDCQLDAQRDFRACIRTAIATCPPAASDVSACSERATAAQARCATPSAGTNAELEACTAD
jgi:hypothetical protein